MEKFTDEYYKKMDEVAEKLEKKHIVGASKNHLESQEILAFTQFYRIQRARGNDLKRE